MLDDRARDIITPTAEDLVPERCAEELARQYFRPVAGDMDMRVRWLGILLTLVNATHACETDHCDDGAERYPIGDDFKYGGKGMIAQKSLWAGRFSLDSLA